MTATDRAAADAVAEEQPAKRFSGALPSGAQWLRHQYPLLILVALLIFASLTSDAFLTGRNLENLVLQTSVAGIVALAQFIVVISGGIDISVGSVLGLSCVLCAGLFSGTSVLLAVVVALAVGALLGTANGLLIAFRGLEPFIVTLGMLALGRGLVYAYTEGVPVRPAAPGFTAVGTATFAGVPVIGWIWILLAVGIPVRTTLVVVYCLAGLLVGLGGFLLASRVGAATPTAGMNFELDAIAAVVIGGTRLRGGQGRVFGAVVGTVIFGVITNLLVLLNVSTFLQDAFRGALILIAVTLATLGRKKAGETP
jgi:ribose/xylose/arabinose/galactoside ABC-type transport system permease subunit